MNNKKYLPILTLCFLTTGVTVAEEGEDLVRPSFSASHSMTITAVVEAIDHDTRVVTVRPEGGEPITFTASDEARNLDQVTVGDVLTAEYEETVSVEVMANDGMQAQAAGASAMARTEKGEMPGVAAMDATVVTATVEEINLERNTFKLKGPDGTINEYLARNPENLKRSKVGDLVVITTTAAVAITVDKPAAE